MTSMNILTQWLTANVVQLFRRLDFTWPGANKWIPQIRDMHYVGTPLTSTDRAMSSLYVVNPITHCSDVIMGTIAFQITSVTTVYSTVYSDAEQRKHQSSASVAFARGIHRGFPAQMAGYAENVSIWWRHHVIAPKYRPFCSSISISHWTPNWTFWYLRW